MPHAPLRPASLVQTTQQAAQWLDRAAGLLEPLEPHESHLSQYLVGEAMGMLRRLQDNDALPGVPRLRFDIEFDFHWSIEDAAATLAKLMGVAPTSSTTLMRKLAWSFRVLAQWLSDVEAHRDAAAQRPPVAPAQQAPPVPVASGRYLAPGECIALSPLRDLKPRQAYHQLEKIRKKMTWLRMDEKRAILFEDWVDKVVPVLRLMVPLKRDVAEAVDAMFDLGPDEIKRRSEEIRHGRLEDMRTRK